MRQLFSFYKSFDDVYKDLNDKQKLEFIDKLLDVQFLRIKVSDIIFDDIILKHIWNAQKHSIDKSVKGYLDSQKNEKIAEPYFGVYASNLPLHIPKEGIITPLQIPSEGVRREYKGEYKGEVKEKGGVIAPLRYAQHTQDTKSKAKINQDYTDEFNNLWRYYTLNFYNKSAGRNDVRKSDTFKNFLIVMKNNFDIPLESKLTNADIINYAIDDEIEAYDESNKIPKLLCNILKIDQLQELIYQNLGDI